MHHLILDMDWVSSGVRFWMRVLDHPLQRRAGFPLATAEQLKGQLLNCFALSWPLQIQIYSPVRQI